MENTLKLFLFFIITIISLQVSLSANAIDLYYANGMFGKDKKEEQKLWSDHVDTLSSSNTYPDLNINPKNAKVAYNASELWGLGDLAEVIPQKVIGDTISWSKVQNWLREYVIENGLIEYFNAKS